MSKAWYEIWFDTRYHDILYRHRDTEDAAGFLGPLISYLHPKQGALLLDIGCGKGRHAGYLASKGFEVTGIDISFSMIRAARKMYPSGPDFYRHDMRRAFRIRYFDCVFFFFTTFGYFDTKKEDMQTLRAAVSALRPGGILVLDFFNTDLVLQSMDTPEISTHEGMVFRIDKTSVGDSIHKTITIQSDKGTEIFLEKVRAYRCADLLEMFAEVNLEILSIFGDYILNPFDPERSPRLIMIAQKKQDDR
ncbi:MAG: class I SAM-dependent methyltransferase [Chitinophagales bacterium]